MKKYKIFLIGIVLVIVALRLESAIRSLKPFYLTLEPIFKHPHATYNEKMSILYPEYFDFITEVKRIIPTNSTVIIPSIEISHEENMWPIANLAITSALLFPRNVIINNSQISRVNSYMIITNGYPQGELKAKRIYIIGRVTNETVGDYDPRNFNESDNGLIQL